ncbi:MAG TPA: sodium-dependent bicarbonate transport family permease [Catalimonadaceae bacterium]|jgi:hypothetical protein|nr:sodium-dependent bicarbonate transport family permease [Catalimonadaceae bacterium]
MNIELLLENLTNPALLFFVLGILAVQLKSDLEIPSGSSKFISLYLLFSIGFKGGQELTHSHFSLEIIWTMVFGIFLACVIPLYVFFLLKKRFGVENAGAVAATYGSVSAVTFVTSISFLEWLKIPFSGHMVAVMALMEAPAIVVGVMLVRRFSKSDASTGGIGKLFRHSLTNGSVLLILGSLVIGFLTSEKQALGIKPFTTDIYKGFLAIFLLDMGILSGRKLEEFLKSGWSAAVFATLAPLVNGSLTAIVSGFITADVGNRLLLSILAASASYIAVPAAMKMAVPKANPGLFLPMALAVTFPFNITFGLPVYFSIIQLFPF